MSSYYERYKTTLDALQQRKNATNTVSSRDSQSLVNRVGSSSGSNNFYERYKTTLNELRGVSQPEMLKETVSSTLFPQDRRSLLKEAQMNRQDSSAAQSRAAPASTSQNYGSIAADAALGFLNQNGVSTKYTQELSKAAQSPAAQSQTAQTGQRQPAQTGPAWSAPAGNKNTAQQNLQTPEQIKARESELGRQMNDALLAGNQDAYDSIKQERDALRERRQAMEAEEAEKRQYAEAMAAFQQASEAKSRGQSFDQWYNDALSQWQTASAAEKELKQRLQAARDQRNQGCWENGVYMGEDHSRDQEIAQLEAALSRLQSEASAAGDSLRYAGWYRYEDLSQMQDYKQQVQAGRAAFQTEEKPKTNQAALDAALYGAVNDPYIYGYMASYENYRTDTSYREPGEGWTAQQKNNFYYLYARDREEAYTYAQGLNDQLAYQKRAAEMQKASEWAQQNGWTEAAGTAAAIVSAPFAIADFLSAANEYSARGTITQRDFASLADYGNAMESGIAEKLNGIGTIDEGLLEGKGLGDLYQLGVSSIQSVTYGNLMGPFGTTAVFFGSAAKSGMDDALLRGATAEQALMFGLMSGLAESACEYFSIDKLLGMDNPKTLAQFFSSFLKQGGVEASEEGMTTLLNTISDAWIMGDKSQVELNVQTYMRQGMSETEARKQAMTDWMNGIAWDMIGGFVSGGVSSSVQQIGQTGANAAAEWLYNRAAASEARQRDTAEWLATGRLQDQQRDALEEIRAANQTRNPGQIQTMAQSAEVMAPGQYTAAGRQTASVTPQTVQGHMQSQTNPYAQAQNSGSAANYRLTNAAPQTVQGRMQSRTSSQPQISAAGGLSIPGQVLQNAGTGGKVGLNRNAGSINTAPTFQSVSQSAAQGKINYEGGAGNEGRIQNLSGIEGRERYLAEPGGIRELQAGRMGPQRAAYAGTESGERIQSQADYRKSSESEIGKLSRESQAGNGGAPGFNGGVSNLPSVQAGTPGIRLVSSYDLGLPGGAKNDRVGLIQRAYYDAEQKRVTKALEALDYEVMLTRGAFTVDGDAARGMSLGNKIWLRADSGIRLAALTGHEIMHSWLSMYQGRLEGHIDLFFSSLDLAEINAMQKA